MDTNEQAIFGFPAHVRLAQPANRESLLALARQRAHDPAILEELEPFFWAAIISNTRLDSYFTHMARSSLENYARGAAEGVSFQNSHRWNELPLGASLTGQVEELDSGLIQVVSDFYTLAGLELNGLNTNQFIQGVRSGVVRDVSIGWSGGTRTCDICGQNYMRCSHWAGFLYEIEENGVIRQVRATVTIENATLHEVSAVYDGATPGAVILKARAAAAEGTLRAKEAEQLEQMYRVNLPITRQFRGVDSERPGQKPREEESMQEDEVKRIQAVFARAEVEDKGDVAASVEALGSLYQHALTSMQKLEPQAAEGRQYRADLVAEALAEGVRAYGKDFDEPTYKATLEASPLTAIKRMRDDWKRIGDARLPAGRTSIDGDEDGRGEPVSVVPDFAYQA